MDIAVIDANQSDREKNIYSANQNIM